MSADRPPDGQQRNNAISEEITCELECDQERRMALQVSTQLHGGGAYKGLDGTHAIKQTKKKSHSFFFIFWKKISHIFL